MYTENNILLYNNKKAGISRFFCLISLLFITYLSIAQNSSKYLISNKQEQGSLYFAKPLTFKGTNHAKLDIDFTLFYNKDSLNRVMVNCSVYSKHTLNPLKNMIFDGLSEPIKLLQTPKLLFVEKKKSKWHYRYSTYISLQEYLYLLQHTTDVYAISMVHDQEQREVFNLTSSFQKSCEIIYQIFTAETGMK